jgi:hypothetical protein
LYYKLYSDGAGPHFFSGTPIALIKNVTWAKIPEPIIRWNKKFKTSQNRKFVAVLEVDRSELLL